MWLYLSFLLIIGEAVADHHYAWETGNEYHFHIESRTLTALDKLAKQFSGILMNGDLTVQVKSLDILQAVVSKSRYASVNKVLSDIWDEITDTEFHELPLSGKPFEIKLEDGVIQNVLVDQDVPTWEVNLLKSIVSQLQIDTEGKNVIASRSGEVPNDNHSSGTFKVMEDSVGGKCEVLYNIKPLNGDNLKVPSLPHLQKDGLHFAITKTKNYTMCERQMSYHSRMVGKINCKPGSNNRAFSRLSTTNIIISGNLKRFTIQSSMMTSQMLIDSKIHDTYSGAVYSGINLTLEGMSQISNHIPASNDLVSTGKLVYSYNHPFSSQRKSRRPSVSQSSSAAGSSENSNSNDSSEENHSSEERDYLQPKSKLDEAPENPLLPYFIGYKSIQKPEENYVLVAARLIGQITEEIEYFPSELLSRPFTEILERYAILVTLIRTMNVEQIAEVENKLPELFYKDNRNNVSSIIDQKLYNETVWDVFCHAVSNAGTGPALITIKNLIKNSKLEGLQAERIISKIPKSVLAPTTEYVEMFFQLITDEQVMKQCFLNTTAPLAFAELVRYTQNNLCASDTVYSDRTVFKHNNALLETYIPYMATKLREAINDGDSRRIQTYIMALSNFGHVKILSVFEPYLEGTLPVSKFQRLMMVVSLHKLIDSFPRVVRSVAYKIYVNEKEAYELRCAAVHIIMKTNPPLPMLERMAKFTNQDQDKHVNSVVKTSIDAVAGMQQPEWNDLAEKARIARKLLNPNIDVENYSHSIFNEMKIAPLNIVQTTILQAIASDDSDKLKGAYFDIYPSYGGFNLSPSKLMYALSSVKDLRHIWYSVLLGQDPLMSENKTGKEWIVEQIIEKLGIEPKDVEQLEGNILADSVVSLKFYPFDNNTLNEFNNMLKAFYYEMSQVKAHVFESRNMNLLHHYDITMGFPTETGLPFIYTLTIPQLTRLSMGGSYDMTVLKQREGFMEMTVAGHILTSEKIQSRIGFVTPFEHRHYIAGIDTNAQFFIPAGLNVKLRYDGKKELQIQPQEYYRYGTEYMAIHHSVVPYTAGHDILDFQPVVFSNNTRLVHTMEPHGREFSLGGLRFAARSDLINRRAPKKMGIDTIVEIGTIFYANLGAHYRRFDVSLHLPEVQVNVTYNNTRGFTVNTEGNSEVTIPATVDKRPDSEVRREQFIKEVVKDNRSVRFVSTIFDISILIENNYYVLTFASADTRNKSQALFYGNVQSPDGEVFWEYCSTESIVGLSRYSHLNVEKAIENLPKYEFETEMRFGSCENGEIIRLKGNLTSSNDVKEMAMNSEIVEKCRQEIKQGNMWLPNCQKANKLIQEKDLLILSMDTNSDRFYLLANRMIISIKMMISDKNIMMLNSNRDDKIMDIKVKMPLNDNDANISLRTSQMEVTFSPSYFIDDPDAVFPNFTLNKLFEETIDEGMCVIDKSQVVTFDNKVYPLNLGKCWHVMMAPYPKRAYYNSEKISSLPDDMLTIVMVREMDDGSKQLRIILADQEIHLQKSGDHFEITVNDKVINHNFSSYEIFEIYELDGMIAVHSLEYHVYIVYDGERALLQVDNAYLNTVRGLCGNYDKQSDNDFVTPKNCILTKPEEFTATYALTMENCEGPALQNKLKAEQSTCIPNSYRPNDVINDREAGRSSRNRRWEYQ